VDSAAVELSPPSDIAEAVPPAKAVVADVSVLLPTAHEAPSHTAIPDHETHGSVPASSTYSSSLATPPSKFSTGSHKKRRSLIEKIKHIFDKDKPKEEKKIKSKH